MKILRICLAIFTAMIALLTLSNCSDYIPTPCYDCGECLDCGHCWDCTNGGWFFLTVYVSLLPAASNMVDPLNGITNSIYMIGGFGSNLALATNPSRIFADWSLTETRPVMNFVSNANGVPLYKGLFSIIATNNYTVNFMFINGTPGYGFSWANAETSDDGYEINNRQINLYRGSNMTVYFTNLVSINGNNIDAGSNGIMRWAGVNPTYPCSNVSVTIICTNTSPAPTDDASNYAFVGSAESLSISGTNTWGDIINNGDQRPVVKNGNVLSLNFTHTGEAVVMGKLMVRLNDGTWSWGDGANVQFTFGLSLTQRFNGIVTNNFFNPAVVW